MDQAKTALSVFVETWESVGRPIHLLVSPPVPRAKPYVSTPTQYSLIPYSSTPYPPSVLSWPVYWPALRSNQYDLLRVPAFPGESSVYRSRHSAPRALTIRRAGNEEAPPKEYRRGHDMKISDDCVRIHSAGQTRIGGINSSAVGLGSMRVSHNQEGRLSSEARW